MTQTTLVDQTLRHAIEETWTLTAALLTTPNPALGLARLTDLTRANAFRWTEAWLYGQERLARGIPGGQAVSRSLALATVASDIVSGYLALWTRAKWAPFLVQDRDWQWQDQRSANRVLETASALGGALIKACQFASTRPDILPAVYIRALAPLQDRLPARPWAEIAPAIARELRRPLGEVFAEIAPDPIAAASIAQVHRARLADGRPVAVKIQYPDIASLVATDLAVLEQVVKLLTRRVPAIQVQPILDYLQQTLPLELDFAHEAAAMTRLRLALQDRPDVLVPAVIPDLSTARLIVMEFVDGIKITDRAALEQAGIDPHAVARLLNDLYADQMLRRGILHADPHPGNLLVQPGPRLVLLDHGLTVPLAPARRGALREIVQALAAGDFAALTGALAAAGLPLDDQVDLGILLRLVGVLLGKEQVGEPGQGGPPGAVGGQLGQSVGSIPFDLLLVGRALGLLDGITRQLDPSLDTIAVVAGYA